MVTSTRTPILWLLALLALCAGCRGQPQGRQLVRSPAAPLAPAPSPARVQSAERETAELPFYSPLWVDAKAGVACLAGTPEEWNTWDLVVWRRGKQPARILSGEGIVGSISASPDGSQVLVYGLMAVSRPGVADRRVSWVDLTGAHAVTKEFYRQVIPRHGAWDTKGARWIARKHSGGYVIHSSRGESTLKEPEPRVGIVTYWLPDSGEWAYVLTTDGAIHRISADGTAVVMRVPPELRRAAGRGEALVFVSQAQISRVDIASGTTETWPLPEEVRRLGEVWQLVVLDDERLALVVGADDAEEAFVSVLRYRDARAEALERVPDAPQSVQIGGDEHGLCIAWRNLAPPRTTLVWCEMEPL